MAKLTTKGRNSLSKGEFALPAQRKYPIPDKAYAANAKSRATQQVARGNLSAAEKTMIDRKADSVLNGRRGKYADGGCVPTAAKPWSNAHR